MVNTLVALQTFILWKWLLGSKNFFWYLGAINKPKPNFSYAMHNLCKWEALTSFVDKPYLCTIFFGIVKNSFLIKPAFKFLNVCVTSWKKKKMSFVNRMYARIYNLRISAILALPFGPNGAHFSFFLNFTNLRRKTYYETSLTSCQRNGIDTMRFRTIRNYRSISKWCV